MPHISPFAPIDAPKILPVLGVRLNGIACNLKPSGRPDLMLAELPEGTTVAGVFTRSLTTAAPVDWCKSILPKGSARALVVHAGNANAFTGRRGMALVEKSTEAIALRIGCAADNVSIAGTGIIAEPIREEQILGSIPKLVEGLRDDGWELASHSIMTTDTYPKSASRVAEISDQSVTISGIAKGAGMIAPDMATMLCFIFTDAKLDGVILQEILNRVNLKTFSNVSIDGDTSTNDTLLLFATGRIAPKASITSSADPLLHDFEKKLTEVVMDLALQVVRDGEGISKFITVSCHGARTESDAHAIARSIAESPLVKSAMGGGSPNWGRIVMAVGKAGRPISKERLKVWLGPHLMASEGDPNDDVDRVAVQAYMNQPEVSIAVDVGMGEKSATIWTCDLTAAYVEINAAYKT
jgi:glutamate N-acetyltransferase/amino-acid N-acetyltransferase